MKELEDILNKAFNEVQDGSSWTTLGGEPPQMHWVTEAIQALLKQEREQAVADYQTEYEQKHLASAVSLAREQEYQRGAVELHRYLVGQRLSPVKVDLAVSDFLYQLEKGLEPLKEDTTDDKLN